MAEPFEDRHDSTDTSYGIWRLEGSLTAMICSRGCWRLHTGAGAILYIQLPFVYS